jgi:hypothetical protein
MPPAGTRVGSRLPLSEKHQKLSLNDMMTVLQAPIRTLMGALIVALMVTHNSWVTGSVEACAGALASVLTVMAVPLILAAASASTAVMVMATSP